MNTPRWTLYKSNVGDFIRAAKIERIEINLDGSGTAYMCDDYKPLHLSQLFLQVARPAAGFYLYDSSNGELLCMTETTLKANYACVEQQGGMVPFKKLEALERSSYPVVNSVKECENAFRVLVDEVNDIKQAMINAGLMSDDKWQ